MKKMFLSLLITLLVGLVVKVILKMIDITFPNLIGQMAIFALAHVFEIVVVVLLAILVILTVSILRSLKPNTFLNDK